MQALSPRPVRSDAAMAVVILLLGLFLTLTGANLIERWHISAFRRQSLGFEDLLGIVANTVGLVMVVWWVISLLIAFAAAVLEKCGSKRAAAATGRYSPAFMRRLALAALGIQLISAPLANAETLPAGPGWSPTQQVAAAAAWAPTGAGESVQLQHPTVAPAAPSPAELPPGAAGLPPDLKPRWKPSSPVAEPGLVVAHPIRASQDSGSAGTGGVTVLAGDSLWSIAARDLGPTASDVDIALHWPRWYQANRAAIGEYPDVLLPGQILKSPSAV
ncbi:LysM domain-containing protein [Micrococcaceae bacterium Sec5.7]